MGISEHYRRFAIDSLRELGEQLSTVTNGEAMPDFSQVEAGILIFRRRLDEGIRTVQPPATGLEEAAIRAEGFLRTLTKEAGPEGLTPIVIGAGLEERHPELTVLARFPELPVVRAQNRSPEELATELVGRWDARSVVFAGLEDEAGRYVPIFERARIATRVITPNSTAQAILSILAQATGLEEATLAAREGFGKFVEDVSTLIRQL